jgi:hypothetical protein
MLGQLHAEPPDAKEFAALKRSVSPGSPTRRNG